MTSPCPVLAGYKLVRSGPCACLSSLYIQNLLAAHAFTVVGLHNLLSVFYYFLVPLFLWLAPLKGWALLDGGLCLSLAHPFFLLSSPAMPFHHSSCEIVCLNPAGPLGLPFILLLMAQYGHWFFYYITGGLLCPICFLLGVLSPFTFLKLP